MCCRLLQFIWILGKKWNLNSSFLWFFNSSYVLFTKLKDELLWAAAWLFRATGDEYYLKYTVDKAVSFGGTGWAMKEFSWDNKYAGVQVLLTKVLLEGRAAAYESTLKQYQAKADYFACACLQKNDGFNINKTPGKPMSDRRKKKLVLF